jgi:hypothetical protein
MFHQEAAEALGDGVPADRDLTLQYHDIAPLAHQIMGGHKPGDPGSDDDRIADHFPPRPAFGPPPNLGGPASPNRRLARRARSSAVTSDRPSPRT